MMQQQHQLKLLSQIIPFGMGFNPQAKQVLNPKSGATSLLMDTSYQNGPMLFSRTRDSFGQADYSCNDFRFNWDSSQSQQINRARPAQRFGIPQPDYVTKFPNQKRFETKN